MTSKKNSQGIGKSDRDRYQEKVNLAKKLKLKKSDLLWFLDNILISRKVDDTEIQMKKLAKAYFQISGAGHEGILSAVAKVLKPKHDWFIPYYRDRALCLGLGVTPKEMLCQANGNVGDTSSHGRQMPAHFGNVDLNIICKSSCTGTQFLQACGLAEAGLFLKKNKIAGGPSYKEKEIIFVSSGDGTTSQGEFWEGLTTACVNKLPVMFLVEDNGYAISVPVAVQTPGGSISKALAEFPGLKIYTCDGNCPIESYATMLEAEEYLRAGKGPVLVHANVTRPYSHSLSDDHKFYRTDDELENEKELDVINSYPKFLVETNVLTKDQLDEIKKEVTRKVKAAMDEALKEPWPERETYADHLYSNTVDVKSHEFETKPLLEGKNDIPMAGAINAVLKSEIQANPLMIVLGQDVADFTEVEKYEKGLKGKGGVFKVTSGVQKVANKGQVLNSPLAEANIIGRSIGMAMRGLKPVVEIQFFDYIWTAYMQLKNEMATTRYRSGGDYKNPMVIRVPIGGYLKGGSIYHSQCGESLFTHVPGIMVVFPSNALDAAGLLRTAIRGDDPVMFLEHKHLYYQGYNRTADPGEDYRIPFGKARIVKEGADLTIVAWGALVQKSVEAAKSFEAEGKTIEIIDPRTLVPFDMETIKKSLGKTNRLLICHEEVKTSGYAGEIAARVNEECFELWDAPIRRVTAKDTHVAYCPGLEDVILPQINDVKEAIAEILNY